VGGGGGAVTGTDHSALHGRRWFGC
jgi:hypothetical protein